MTTILIVDDDPDIREVLSFFLKRVCHYETIEAEDGSVALNKLGHHKIDLVLLDVGMPGDDGFEVYKKIQNLTPVPTIFLTAHDTEVKEVQGLGLGAEDYITKPYNERVLEARIKKILNVGVSPRVGDLSLDLDKREVYWGQNEVKLTKTQFDILQLLISQTGRVFSYENIRNRVWPVNAYVSDEGIRSHIRGIRDALKVIAPNCPAQRLIQAQPGIGYKLNKVLIDKDL